MTEGPDWGPTFAAIKRPRGAGASKSRIGLDEIEAWQKFQQQRTGADVAVALGGVDTGDDFDGWGYVNEWATAQTAAIANLEEIAAAGNATPAYAGDLFDMVSVFRTMMVGYGPASGGGAGTHTHPIICPSLKPNYANGVGAPPTGDIWFSPIISNVESYVRKMRWAGGIDPSIFGMQWYEKALMIYNPSNGNLEKAWTSGNIKDTVAAVTTMAELEVDLTGPAPGPGGTGPISQRTKPSQILFAATQQIAPGFGQSARSVGIVPQPGMGRPSSLVLDAAVYIAPNHTQGIPSSIAFNSLSKSNAFIPWDAVSTSVEAP
ncbi:hypothetical protein [Mycolicibacterium sp. A43C]